MGRDSYRTTEILLFYNGQRCGSILRVLFGNMSVHGTLARAGAVGYVNYKGSIGTVRKSADGAPFIEETESLIRGQRPLTRGEDR